MKIYKLERKQVLKINKENCWKFFSDPANLQKITPPDMDFKIISKLPEEIYEGQIIIYKIKLFPWIKLNWATEITHKTMGKYFVDEQRFGPYKFWHHQHIFKELENGMEVYDLVHYAVPFGFAGRLINKIFIGNKLNKIFQYRKEFLEKSFNNSILYNL